ncbi:DUF167 domain-containing protein [Schlesneria paludicola]|uniref:DUF167 domain-containing protein n=1 Tax=Schlesneria paludicola TaxID=360056 RepID=UPI00029A3369|nr:DUF167 domain-containing protein [Schlesneria paludicola]
MSELTCDESPDGAILRVKAHAGARRNGITGTFDGAIRVAVTQAPEKGKANSAIIQVLADALKIGPSRFEILSGHTANLKRILVRGFSSAELLDRLNRILADDPAHP